MSEIFIRPQTVLGGGGGVVYCFDVVVPSVRQQHIKSLNEIHETW